MRKSPRRGWGRHDQDLDRAARAAGGGINKFSEFSEKKRKSDKSSEIEMRAVRGVLCCRESIKKLLAKRKSER